MQATLKKSKDQYQRQQPRKWLVTAIFILFGVVVSFLLPPLIFKLMNSKYSRASLDNIMMELLGDANIEDAITDELLVVAYDYNS